MSGFITKTLSLKVLRPYWGDEIEKQIRVDKELNKKNGGKGILGFSYYNNLKKDNPEIVTKREFCALMSFFQEKMSIAYNRGISRLYIEKIINKSDDSVDKLLSSIVYKEAYKELKSNSMALGLRSKVKSNFSKTNKFDLMCARMSLPSAKRDTFPIPMYKPSNKDEHKVFTIEELDNEFVLSIKVPQYTYTMKKNKKTDKEYLDFKFVDTTKKKEIKLIISTKRHTKNNGWMRDEGTDSEIRRMMNGNLQKEWLEYSINHYNDDCVVKQSKYKKLETFAIQESLRNKYKCGYLELNRGKKIGEKTQWFVNIAVTFPPKEHKLDMNIIGGIDIGMSKPIVCAVSNSLKRLSISKNEVMAYNIKALSRRRGLLKRNRYSRTGHGLKNKLKISMIAAQKDEQRRNKMIEKWASEVVAFFVSNNVGIVQREDLKSLKNRDDREGDSDFFKFQRMYWCYARIQNQIDKKLIEKGIVVKVIKPYRTSRLCHSCHTLNDYFTFDYRASHKFPNFKCMKCNVTCDADYNASKNMTDINIEQIAETAEVCS